MITDIDAFIGGLENGSSTLDLVRLDDADFQAKMEELEAYFTQLKKEIAQVRIKDYHQTDIINKSERFLISVMKPPALQKFIPRKRPPS